MRARDLVRQILSFSRMKKAERRPVCLAEVVREAISLLRSSLPSTIHILEDGLEGEQALVMADPTQLHQVIMNLGTNSTHAMRGRAGVLSFKLAQLPADAPEQDGARPARMCITVSDTGNGMSPEVLARLFEPFFTTKGQGEGTGLGMSVVHGIVQSHGGTIAVESQVGVGTSVRIELPLHTGELRSTEPVTVGLPLGRGESLLFIDDEPQICQFAQKMLTRLGYHVTSCTNPLEALELLVPGECRFALVVTDLTMPNMTGIELARRIRDGHPRLPLLLSSGLPGVWTNERLAEVGINGLLTKPLSIQSLAGAVRRMLDVPSAEQS
jgi:CheY-like chemotaxis protein/two-component sensor histidine kinase